MALPEKFSETKHLQDTIAHVYNQLVRDWFRDMGGDEWELDVSTPRASIRTACTHKPKDTYSSTLMRQMLFNLVRERDQVAIAGLPMDEVHASRKFKPQILLYFQEDAADVDPGFSPVTGTCQFRIMDDDNPTPTDAQVLATRIKSEFAGAGGYVWRKGRAMMTYRDPDRGYQFQILCRDNATGRAMVQKVLDCRNHTPDWALASYKESEEPATAYPTLPPTRVIYGQSRREPRRRPVADVRFQYAVLHIWGLPNPVCLVDRSGVWPAPIERA